MAEYIDREKVEKAINQHRCDTSRIEEAILYIPSANVIPIPEGTTNGDMIKAMFPNIEVKPQMSYGFKNGIKVRVYKDEFSVFDLWFPSKWWDTPYKGVKNDNK